MGKECCKCDCPQGEVPGADGINEAHPPSHALATIKGWKWLHLGDVQYICTPSPPCLRKSGDVNYVDGDCRYKQQFNINVIHISK